MSEKDHSFFYDAEYEVSRKCSASIAHRIFGHPAACKRLHGHNYHFTLHISARVLNNMGMVVDFGYIKECFDQYIKENWDHHTLLFEHDPLAGYVDSSMKRSPNFKNQVEDSYVFVEWNPTAENMARHLTHVMREKLWRDSLFPFVTKITVDVEETDGNTASYCMTVLPEAD